MQEAWGEGREHLSTGEPMAIDALNAVTSSKAASNRRWCVVYAYRNSGAPSNARRISFPFETSCRRTLGNLADLY